MDSISTSAQVGSPTLAQNFAEFASRLEATAPDAVLQGMRPYVLDTLAVMISGSTSESSSIMLRSLVRSGSAREATVAGAGKVASTHDAALLNGAFSHALELDDDHRVAVLHPGAVVVPAALAASEGHAVSGRRFLAAVLGGYEVMCRLGLAFRGSPFQNGLHPTALFGVFGAATAAGIAQGLDAAAITRSLGIAGTQASGLTEWRADGSWIKRLHPGRAAQSGVLAATLAAEGFTGPATIFEGPGGFFRAFSHGMPIDADVLVHELGGKFHALDTAIKPYPCCRFMHGAIDLAIEAYRGGLRAGDIERVDIRIYETGVLSYHQVPLNNVDAQFNVPYGVACALMRGELGLDDYTPEQVQNADTLAMCARINAAPSEEYSAAYPDVYNVEMIVTTTAGERHRFHSTCPSGDPEAAAYRADPALLAREAEDKACRLLRQCGFDAQAERLAGQVDSLLDNPSLDELLALIALPPR